MNSQKEAFVLSLHSSYTNTTIGIQHQAWPLWVAALAVLSALGTGSANAVPHAKATDKSKVSHSRPVAQGTYLLTTGTVDPVTLTVKAISDDNHFTWVRLIPTATVTQGGRSITLDKIGEGDKLLCQGNWADDGWGPVFQANRVDVVGTVSATTLQNRVAAACHTITTDRGNNAPNAFSADDTEEKYDGFPSDADSSEEMDRALAESRAFERMDRLAEAADEDKSLRHNPAAVQAIRRAVIAYKRSIDLRQNLPVAPIFRAVEVYKRQYEDESKVYANLLVQYFGTNSSHGYALKSQSRSRLQRLNAAARQSLRELRDEKGL